MVFLSMVDGFGVVKAKRMECGNELTVEGNGRG